MHGVPNTAAEPRGFLPEVHLLRAFAIFSIVGGHALRWADLDMGTGLGRWLAVLLRGGSIYFVFVAGLLFHHLGAGHDLRRLAGRKWQTVVLPYLCWSLPVLLLFALDLRAEPRWALEQYGHLPELARYGMYIAMGGHMPHFWFVPVMVLLLLLSPLWRWLGKSPWLYPCALLAVVVALLLPRQAQSQESLSVLRRLGHFSSVYLLGVVAARHRAVLMAWLARFGALPLAGGLLLALFEVQRWLPGAPLRYFSKLLLCLGLLWLFDGSWARLPGLLRSFADRIARDSYAIYLSHYYVLLGICGALVPTRTPAWRAQDVEFGVALLSTMLLSFACIAALRRLLGARSRPLVGA